MASTPFDYTWEAPTFTWADAEAEKTWATAFYYTHTVDPAESFGWADSVSREYSLDFSEASTNFADDITPSLDYWVDGDESFSWADDTTLESTVASDETWDNADALETVWSAEIDLPDGWGNADDWSLDLSVELTETAWNTSDSATQDATVAPDDSVAFADGFDRLADFNTDWSESWDNAEAVGNDFTRPISETSWSNADSFDRTWVIDTTDHDFFYEEVNWNDDNYDPFVPLVFQVGQGIDEGWNTADVYVDTTLWERSFSESWGNADAPAELLIELGKEESWNTDPSIDYINANTLWIEEETLWFNQTVSTWDNVTLAWEDRNEDWLNLFEVAPTLFVTLLDKGVPVSESLAWSESSTRETGKGFVEASVNFADDFAYVNAFIQEIAESLGWSDTIRFALDGPHLTDGWGNSDSIINAMTWADPAPAESFAFTDGGTIGTLVDRGVPISQSFTFSDGFSYILANVAARGVLSDNVVLDYAVLTPEDFDELMTSRSPPGFTDWALFLSGDYDYQKAYIRIRMDPTEIGQSPQLTRTAVVVDVPDVTDGGNASVTGTQLVPFNKSFHEPPDVVAMMTAGSTWAVAKIVSVSTTGFQVELLTKNGNTTSGTINWQAEGY